MGHTDKIDATDTLVPNGDLTTRKLYLLERISRLASRSRIFRASAVTIAVSYTHLTLPTNREV